MFQWKQYNQCHSYFLDIHLPPPQDRLDCASKAAAIISFLDIFIKLPLLVVLKIQNNNIGVAKVLISCMLTNAKTNSSGLFITDQMSELLMRQV